jgi:hypothetical protein
MITESSCSKELFIFIGPLVPKTKESPENIDGKALTQYCAARNRVDVDGSPD